MARSNFNNGFKIKKIIAHNEKLTNRVREALQHLDNVEEKKMFRGTTFMVNGKMCFSSGDDKLMCRIDPTIHDDLLRTKKCETMKMKNKEYRGYLFIHEDNLKAKKEFEFWINLALDFNKKARSSKKKKKSSR
ncbi:MAG: TfoX/Sxy family protein [Bacteroidota bacterium]